MAINFELMNNVGKRHYMQNYHVSTRKNWTHEEFQAESRRFAINVDDRQTYLEDYMNYRQERLRRALEASRDSNQFSIMLDNFSPHVVIGGGNAPRIHGHDSGIFQSLAEMLESQRAGLHTLHSSLSRFVTDEDFELRLSVLHEQFNQAFKDVANIFRNFAAQLGMDTEGIHSDVLIIGDLIRDHVWSGGSADTIEEMLESRNLSMSVNQLNQIGTEWHARFGFNH
jgi:hypothetical protein